MEMKSTPRKLLFAAEDGKPAAVAELEQRSAATEYFVQVEGVARRLQGEVDLLAERAELFGSLAARPAEAA